MVEVTFPCTIYFLIFPTYLLYYALINYVAHSNWNYNLHHRNNIHILLDPPLNLGFDESIKSKVFEFSWGSAVTPTPYAYFNLLNKKASTPFERKYHLVCTTFLVFVDAGATSHGGRWRYAFKSSSRTRTTKRAWKSTVRLKCFSTAAQRRTAQKNGAHSSRSFGLGSSIVS